MKKLISIMSVVTIVASYSLQAQTNSPAGTIFNSIESYFTSFNTNYAFNGVKLEVSSGYAQVTGVNAASYLDANYDINNFNIDTSFQFSGVGSAVNAAQIGIGYSIVNYYDTKADVSVLGGYDDTRTCGVFTPRLTLKKKLTPNTFAETGLEFPIYTDGTFVRTPTIKIGVGFTF